MLIAIQKKNSGSDRKTTNQNRTDYRSEKDSRKHSFGALDCISSLLCTSNNCTRMKVLMFLRSSLYGSSFPPWKMMPVRRAEAFQKGSNPVVGLVDTNHENTLV